MDALTIFIAVSTALAAFLLRLVSSEIQDWMPLFARWFVGRAVSRLPEYERPRYREQWLADLDEYPGKLAKLCRALGFLYGASDVGRCLVEAQNKLSLRNSDAPQTENHSNLVIDVSSKSNDIDEVHKELVEGRLSPDPLASYHEFIEQQKRLLDPLHKYHEMIERQNRLYADPLRKYNELIEQQNRLYADPLRKYNEMIGRHNYRP